MWLLCAAADVAPSTHNKHLAKFLQSFREPSVFLSITEEPCDSRRNPSSPKQNALSFLIRLFFSPLAMWPPLLLPSFSLKWDNFAESKLMAVQAGNIWRAESQREGQVGWNHYNEISDLKPHFCTAFLPIPDIFKRNCKHSKMGMMLTLQLISSRIRILHTRKLPLLLAKMNACQLKVHREPQRVKQEMSPKPHIH